MIVNLNRNIIFILDLKNSELINLPIKKLNIQRIINEVVN